eukprot:Hpha_TRINITY_DN15643_c1_g9::TRINITY_DN15643_c1_g9_i1::g.101267::m.101267/K05970/SIAE; sialate O-acetylesterase
MAAAGAVLAAMAVGATPQCDIAGAWVLQGGKPVGRVGYIAGADNATDGTFSVNYNVRHGPGLYPGGRYSGALGVTLPFNDTVTLSGEFSPNCTTIVWDKVIDRIVGGTWCKAWTPGCLPQPAAPYGSVVGFYQTLGDNMVLQRGPGRAAVYGVLGPNATTPREHTSKVTVTVTKWTAAGPGESYSIPAETDTVHQATGPQFAGMGADTPGPWATWKALLRAEDAGGNYSITVTCDSCAGTILDPALATATIVNVTFGDVWHCSGQSNMWLPVSHSFHANATYAALRAGKYAQLRVMDGNSGNGQSVASNPWRRAADALGPADRADPVALGEFGAACWYFGQRLADYMEEAGDTAPLGLIDTAIGGQRIEEYMVNDTSLYACSDRLGATAPEWNGRLFGKMITPYVDMTTKGWVWYQGENNMGGTKGSSSADVGYGCEQRNLVEGWRKVWSKTPGTTDPMAPFGVVTLASSGSEGGPHMGAMRWAQTANYGVLPNAAMPNTFLAQAYDLDDEWGPGSGPCINEWACCPPGAWKAAPQNMTACKLGTKGNPSLCDKACLEDTVPVAMGGIHPRSKYPVGDRLATAYWNTLMGGKAAGTGPTLSGCSVSGGELTIRFNTSLLRGDKVTVQKYNSSAGLSFLDVMTDPTHFCVEPMRVNATNASQGLFCPKWAGGDAKSNNTELDQGWVRLDLKPGADGVSVTVDLKPLNGTAPAALRYAWGITDCCDHSDPTLYVTHGCVANCPILGSSGLPANPFIARIVGGKCECVAPQVC